MRAKPRAAVPLVRMRREKRPSGIPNAMTLAGYACTLGWALGGPWYLAIAGLVADELDGRIARRMGEATEQGGLLDWGTDIALTPLCALRAGVPWAALPITAAQVALRHRGVRPTVGSARAALTLLGMLG